MSQRGKSVYNTLQLLDRIEAMQKNGPTRLSRYRIWESNWGRNNVWLMERYGEVIAALVDPSWDDMFWFSYEFIPLVEDEEILAELYTRKFWNETYEESCQTPAEIVWRHLESGEIAEHAFPGLSGVRETGRISMRSLCLSFREPYLWESLILWYRKRSAKKNTEEMPENTEENLATDETRIYTDEYEE